MIKRLLFLTWACAGLNATAASTTNAPNVILILADDLGYGDIGCYGQKQIRTPSLDRLAAEGMRFTQFYAGSAVCAPSRCSLMTGKHTGHCSVRGNLRPEAPLAAAEATLPQVLQSAGYATALVGKWGVGGVDSPGGPNRKGFGYFFGYPSQRAAHDYYPPFLLRNTNTVPLPANTGGRRGAWSHDLFVAEAMDFIRTNRARPFFLCLSVTIPHANNEEKPNGMQVPDDRPYSTESWPQTEKNFAAMITRLDDSVGRIMGLLREVGLENRTLVLFTSDNGPHSEGGHQAAFFRSSGLFRGMKRDQYEGGIRVPLIVRWPGTIKGGTVSDQVAAFWDMLPTLAALCGRTAPPNIDGVSFAPALLENRKLPHPPLYWEFHEKGFFRAARIENWKGVSLDPAQPLELYDLAADPAEKKDLASAHPEVVRRIEEIMQREHVPHPAWPDDAREPGP